MLLNFARTSSIPAIKSFSTSPVEAFPPDPHDIKIIPATNGIIIFFINFLFILETSFGIQLLQFLWKYLLIYALSFVFSRDLFCR